MYKLCALPIQLAQTRLIHGTWKVFTYRCFLPDLTGFMSFHCVGPSSQHHLYRSDHTFYNLGEEFTPAVAGCRLQGTANSPASTEI